MRTYFTLAESMFPDYAWDAVKDESPDHWPVGYDLLRDAQLAADPRQYLRDHYVALAASWHQTTRSCRTYIGVLPGDLSRLISQHFIDIERGSRSLLRALKDPNAEQNYIDSIEIKYMGLPASINNMPCHIRFHKRRIYFASWQIHHVPSKIQYAKTDPFADPDWCYVYAQPQPHTPDWQPGKFYYAETRPPNAQREADFGTIPDSIAADHMREVLGLSYKFLDYMQKQVA